MALIIGCGKGICLAVDLDSPVEKKITTRSEIKRGLKGLSRCGEKAKKIEKGVQLLSECISSINSEQTHTEPFLLGFYYSALEAMEIKVKTGEEYYSKYDWYQLYIGKQLVKQYYKEFRNRQVELNIDNKSFCDAANFDFNYVNPKLEEWEKTY
jgi:hypothetical protein